jgi:hypothetical protein
LRARAQMRAAGLGEDHRGLRRLLSGREVGEHRVRVGHLERVALFLRLDEHLLDDAVLHEHRIAPRALAEAQVRLVDEHSHASVKPPLPSGRKVTFGAFWSFCHSDMTNASFTEMQTISSTPRFEHGASSL